MNPLNDVAPHTNYFRTEAQKQPEILEQGQVQPIMEFQLDMAKKEPFHFLHLVQRQLMESKRHVSICPYPNESREIWIAFGEAVRDDDREKAENLRRQLFPNSGSLIEPKCTPFENPKTEDEELQNILIKALCLESTSIPEKLLCCGLEENSLPLIYLALQIGAEPEKLFKGDMGREHHFLQIALGPKPCDLAGIRLLFQFARNSTNFANGTLCTKPTPRTPFSPLEKAFAVGRLDVVRELLANGAKPDIAWNEQVREENLFMDAANNGHSEIVQFFLQAGFPVNYKDKNGRTALHFAQLRKNNCLVNDLLMAGADPKLTDNNGWNYIQFAEDAWKKFDKTAREKLIPAFQTGDFERVHGAGGIEKVVSSLLNINESLDTENNSLLHIAMKHLKNYYGSIKEINEIRQLIDLGANVHQENEKHETPCVILQKAIAAQEQLIHKIIKSEPLEETGISVIQQIVIDAVKEAQLEQENADIIRTKPLVPIFIKRVKDEQKYLKSLQSFHQLLVNIRR